MATLKELVKNADLSTRKMSNHLRYDVVSTARQVRGISKSSRQGEVSDREVRDQVTKLLDAERYTNELYKEVMTACIEIHKSLQQTLSE